MWVADFGASRILELSASGRLLHRWGSHGARPGQLDGPAGVAIDAHGNLYVADFNNRWLQKLSPSGAPLARWNKNDPQFGCECKDATLDDHGHLYVVDEGDVELFRLTPSLKVTAMWNTSDNSLEDRTLDRRGNFWIVTAGNQVEELSSGGKVVQRWGRSGKRAGQLDEPQAIALDARGNIYVADANNDRVQKLSPAGKPLAIFGTKGSDLARSSHPEAVAIDRRSDVLVADSHNSRIQVFSPNGNLLAIWRSS